MREEIRRIVGDEGAAELLVKKAMELGEDLRTKGLKMAQIRDVFDELRQIESVWMRNPQQAIRRLHLLRPKLYYRKRRHSALDPLVQALDIAVQEVVAVSSEDEMHKRFQRLKEFVEAVVAYHGGDR
ncbi:type III-A CRISPR-associated protein Csm2 [Candidatus Bipolaricaulota bacterium]|nr:type III-A CRISPR-associated protein Csm2 [Candidatus Bipolaricaulota bacterium]